ncbi:hypothetical protein RN001_008812 [Aquatica leii]|uniref:Uncharacterized protein n=1 Tax=Aquatica leii TaxID=1421715 RepID=A0AAN7S9V8_9COLE|nr:hypothetical protein RN001_008812 [Aquatica leii]
MLEEEQSLLNEPENNEENSQELNENREMTEADKEQVTVRRRNEDEDLNGEQPQISDEEYRKNANEDEGKMEIDEASTSRSAHFFDELENEMKVKLPVYLKNILSINGYESNLTLSHISNEDIAQIESFGKKIAPKIIPEEKHEEYLGVFSKHPEHFQIVAGHKKLIFLILEQCKRRLEIHDSSEEPRNRARNQLSLETSKPEYVTKEIPSETHLQNSVADENLGEEKNCIERALKNWLKSKIEYDPYSDKLVGFVLPMKNGMPNTEMHNASSAKAIEESFKYPKSNYAYTIMAQPLSNTAPPYCLSIFGTNNKFTAEDVQNRWITIRNNLKYIGIEVVGISSDGDTRWLKAMRHNISLPISRDRSSLNDWEWYRIKCEDNTISYLQDAYHIETKSRTRLLKEGIIMPLGSYQVSVTHLEELIKSISKDQHLITMSDLKAEDKMNFSAAEKISSQKILNQLENFPESAGTKAYLQIMNFINKAFIDKNTPVSRRVYCSWLRKSKMDCEMDSADFDVKNISDNEIQATVESALQDVMFKIRELGMSVKGNCWNHIDTPSICDNRENIHDEIHDEEKILVDVGADETNSLSKRFLEDLETGERKTSELPDDLLKDLEKIHCINGISSDGLHLKDYSAKKETGRYVAVSVGDKTSIIRK